MTSNRMAVVIPAWNEATRFPVAAAERFLEAVDSVDLCLVDDGSTDGTAGVLEAFAAGHPGRVTVLRQDVNRGKAEAVRLGLVWSAGQGYPIAGYLDADLAAPLDAALLLRETLEAEPALALVIGSRVKLLGWRITRSERRHYLGRIFATFASLTLGLPVYDTQCGAKALRLTPEVVEQLQVPFMSRWLFDVELIARLRDAVGVGRLREVPLAVWEDPGGSTVRFCDFLKAPLELWRIRRRYPVHRK